MKEILMKRHNIQQIFPKMDTAKSRGDTFLKTCASLFLQIIQIIIMPDSRTNKANDENIIIGYLTVEI